MSTMIDVVGDPDVIAKISELARSHGLEVSAPMATESVSDALDTPFGAEEVRQFFEMVTIIAKSGTAIIGFLAAAKLLLKRSEGSDGKPASIEVKDTTSQRLVGKVDGEADLDALEI